MFKECLDSWLHLCLPEGLKKVGIVGSIPCLPEVLKKKGWDNWLYPCLPEVLKKKGWVN